MTMRDYSRLETAALLQRLANQVEHAADTVDEDAVHDLRVVIRRVTRCLRVFAQFYPGNTGKKLRAQLHELMEAAGSVRDLDIAMGLLSDAGLPANASIRTRLSAERRKRGRHLSSVVKDWNGRRLRRWSRKLKLQA